MHKIINFYKTYLVTKILSEVIIYSWGLDMNWTPTGFNSNASFVSVVATYCVTDCFTLSARLADKYLRLDFSNSRRFLCVLVNRFITTGSF